MCASLPSKEANLFKLIVAVKHLMRLDTDDPRSHICLIKFFNKVSSLSAPVTDTEKLVWGVLEAERVTFSQLLGKSLIEANDIFLEQHKESLMDRVAVAELLCVLEPNQKAEAVKLIEDSVTDLGSINGRQGHVRAWKLKNCISAHKLLETTLNDHDAASNYSNLLPILVHVVDVHGICCSCHFNGQFWFFVDPSEPQLEQF